MKHLLMGALLLILSAGPSLAQDSDTSDLSYLSFGVGYYDVFEPGDGGAADFRAEYRHGKPLFWVVKPWAGVEANSDASVWAGGGVLADFKIAPNIYLAPSAGIGLYAPGSSDKDLDSPVQFRTQLEGGYEFINGHRVGVALSHISNGGLGDDNPGAEVLNLYYHVPFGGF